VRTALQAGSLDDILQSEENLADQLDSLPFLCRFQYEKAAAFMASYLDPAVERFKQLASAPPASAREVEVVEAQLAWLVFLVGAIVKGRLSSSSAESQVRPQLRCPHCCRRRARRSPPRVPRLATRQQPSHCADEGSDARASATSRDPLSAALLPARPPPPPTPTPPQTHSLPALPCPPAPAQEAIDGDLSSRVFALLAAADEGYHRQRYEEPSRQRLDNAIINFFQAFRRVYIGEQARPPCTLHPAPCTLHPAPCTLHPAPCTLHPQAMPGQALQGLAPQGAELRPLASRLPPCTPA
jgi:hypothetical protein